MSFENITKLERHFEIDSIIQPGATNIVDLVDFTTLQATNSTIIANMELFGFNENTNSQDWLRRSTVLAYNTVAGILIPITPVQDVVNVALPGPGNVLTCDIIPDVGTSLILQSEVVNADGANRGAYQLVIDLFITSGPNLLA